MRNPLCWFLSILLHGILVFVLLQAIHLTPYDLKDVMEVDLTKMEIPEEVAHMPVPQKPISPEPIEPETTAVTAPLPQDKTVVLDDSPQEEILQTESESVMTPEPIPDVVEISPVKTEQPEDKPTPKKIMVRKGDFIVSRGHEARFGRSLMADYYSYSANEFSGQFKTADDRVITIIDARNTKYGRFLIYDSKNKTLRRLKAFGKYVYTIGPSVHADEPVTGSVTFLAKEDRIERFILMTDDDRIAHYPRKVHVRDDDILFSGTGGELHGHTSLPPYGEGHAGMIFVHGNACEEPGLIQGFTRTLSMLNLASLSFMPRGCSGDNPTPGSEAELTEDISSALSYLADRPQVDPKNIGIWGNGPGVVPAISAINASPQTPPKFMVCVLNDALDPKTMPNWEELAKIPVPVLWLITGRNTAKWRPYLTTLESLRDQDKRPFSIIIAPLKASQDVLDAEGAQSAWIEQVAEDHARLAASWIQNLGKPH